ncbi:hypothetical protein QBC47DRAFT_55395 [Echria macrotheca]|uniref:Zn(2)-C6 fungal-type domain-containing protein n=1 Tax=Echria macrotheca TaxID=438768 RepID=A0AAJ0B9R8_9PEZI|nr:hypothetical protein QBC47DRAFT_55395 [Echria macrotheca]
MSRNAPANTKILPAVPRSKGCINCTARKTRCDGRRPSCRACEHRGQICHGYRRGDFVFMNEGWRAPGVASSGRLTSAPPPPMTKPVEPDPLPIYVSFFLSQFTKSPPPQALVMVHSCHQYLGHLLHRPLPGPNGSDCDPLADAAEALVTNHFGRLNSLQEVVHRSITPYVRALRALSTRLSQVQRVGIASIQEEEVLRLIFASLFLTFWELAMNPQTTTWQRHIRGLASVIESRGPKGFQSYRSLQIVTLLRLFILLEAVSSKRPTFLSSPEWRSLRFSQPHWPSDASAVVNMTQEIGPRRFLDFVIDQLTTVTNLVAEFSDLRSGSIDTLTIAKLDRMHCDGLLSLRQLEAALAYMEASFVAPFVSTGTATNHPQASRPATSTKGPFWERPLEYNLTSLCRTTAVTPRLLLYDLTEHRGRGLGMDYSQDLAMHGLALLRHVEAIITAIPYSSRGDIFGVAPLCFVPAFKVAKVVLARGSLVLPAKDVEHVTESYAQMSYRIQGHLDYVTSQKIAVGVDF